MRERAHHESLHPRDLPRSPDNSIGSHDHVAYSPSFCCAQVRLRDISIAICRHSSEIIGNPRKTPLQFVHTGLKSLQTASKLTMSEAIPRERRTLRRSMCLAFLSSSVDGAAPRTQERVESVSLFVQLYVSMFVCLAATPNASSEPKTKS